MQQAFRLSQHGRERGCREYEQVVLNLVFAPLAKKIRQNMAIVETREKVTIEGVILIKEGKSELMIKDQLFSLLGKGSSD